MPSLKPDGKRLNGKGSHWIADDVRYSIYLRDGFRCAYCQRDLRYVEARERTLDHIEPKVNGANHHPTNLLTACLRCNSRRQHMPFRDWVELRIVAQRHGYDFLPLLAGAEWRQEVGREVHRLKMQARRKLPLALAREMLGKRKPRKES